jgi:hypothetical protein
MIIWGDGGAMVGKIRQVAKFWREEVLAGRENLSSVWRQLASTATSFFMLL